jgi:hypothetical protein
MSRRRNTSFHSGGWKCAKRRRPGLFTMTATAPPPLNRPVWGPPRPPLRPSLLTGPDRRPGAGRAPGHHRQAAGTAQAVDPRGRRPLVRQGQLHRLRLRLRDVGRRLPRGLHPGRRAVGRCQIDGMPHEPQRGHDEEPGRRHQKSTSRPVPVLTGRHGPVRRPAGTGRPAIGRPGASALTQKRSPSRTVRYRRAWHSRTRLPPKRSTPL